jgi:hypothetical protein
MPQRKRSRATARQSDGSVLAETRGRQSRSRVTNGKQLFLDGEVRNRASRRFRDLLAGIASDLGGVNELSVGQMQLARRCALLSVQCEIMEAAAVDGKDFDLDQYGQLTDRLGRAFQRLGLRRQPRDITPTICPTKTSSWQRNPDPVFSMSTSPSLAAKLTVCHGD